MSTRFGPFELNDQTRELRLSGEPVPLQPRVFDVLEYLVRHRDRVVGKEELLNTLWPDMIVTDASLQRTISLIRTALRPGGWADAIQTRSRLGYRFLIENPAEVPEPKAAPIDEPAAALLERELFLDELNRRFHRAQAGEGQVVFISGEAGIGKSALLATFLGGVGREAVVLRGYCDALFTPRAFGAILDVAAQLPEEKTTPLTPDASRDQVFARLYRRLHSLTPGPIVVLEDLHWADEATLDFVRFLGRRIAGTRGLLLATYRDEERGPSRPPSQALGDLTGPNVTRQLLKPLTAAAVARLAREAGRAGDERIFDLAGGNPFLTRELLSSPASGVPGTVRDSMVARLARCSELARKVCHVVALLPGRAEMDLVGKVLGEVGEAVDEAIARGVIAHEGGALAYRHELARRAVENILAPAESRGLHARILAALRERHADVARLVHHARCAGDRPAVLALAPEAARRAIAVDAHREAAAHYAAALAFADELPASERAALLEKHAYECYLTGRISTAVESAAAALALWRELGDRLAEGRTLRFISRQHWFLGDRAKAERFAADAIEVLAALPPSRDLAMAYSNRSQLGMLKGEVAFAVDYGEKAATLARWLHDPEIECHALNNMGTARLTAGDRSGLPELERSLQLALAGNFHEHAARAYVNLATSTMRQQDVTSVRRYLGEGLAYCEDRDLDSWTAYLKVYHGRFLLERGDWNQAETEVTRLLKDGTTATVTRIPALVVLASIHLRRGLPGAAVLLDEALALALPTGEVQRIGPVAAARAEAAWLRGDTPAILREVEQGLALAIASNDHWMLGELLIWKSLATSTPKIPERVPEPYRLAMAGDWRAAAAGFARHEMPYERALALARGDGKAVVLAKELLTQLGAAETITVLAREKKR